MTKWYTEQRAIKAVILIGIALSLIQFLYNRSLWLDEGMLARNIINRSSLELLKPLDDDQVAPVLFLEVAHLFSILIPDSEYGLRLLPLLCFWMSLVLFHKVMCLVFNRASTVIVSVSLFALNYTLLYYASEAKQHMCDVFVLTSLYYTTLRSYSREQHKYCALGIVGTVCVFLSNITPLVLMSVGVYSVYDCWKNQKTCLRQIAAMSLIWTIAFALSYYWFIHEHPAREFMTTYWSNADGFMPYNPFQGHIYRFLWDNFTMLIEFSLPFSAGKYLLGMLCVLGPVVLIVQKRWGLLLLMVIPVLLHLSLSALKLYPIGSRLMLYACPLVIVATSLGFDYLRKRVAKGVNPEMWRLLVALVPILLCVLFCIRTLQGKFPQQREEVKSSMSYISANMSEGDNVYVYWGAAPVFKYYSDIRFTHFTGPITFGVHRIWHEEFMSELRNLTGRNWLLFAHAAGEDNVLRQLDSLGYHQIQVHKATGSSAYLYDFSAFTCYTPATRLPGPEKVPAVSLRGRMPEPQ